MPDFFSAMQLTSLELVQPSGAICILDKAYLTALGQPNSTASVDLHSLVVGEANTAFIYAVDPATLSEIEAESLQLPEGVRQVCDLASGKDVSLVPHNAIIERWQQQDGLSVEVAWKAAGQMLQQHHSSSSQHTPVFPWPAEQSLQPDTGSRTSKCHLHFSPIHDIYLAFTGLLGLVLRSAGAHFARVHTDYHWFVLLGMRANKSQTGTSKCAALLLRRMFALLEVTQNEVTGVSGQ